MMDKIIDYIEKSLNEFEELSQVVSNKEKFKIVGNEALQNFFTNLFLKEPFAKGLLDNDFIVGVIHFWSYPYQERLARPYFPESAVQTPYQKVISSYGGEKRGKIGEMVYRDSKNKVPVAFRIGNYQLMKKDSEKDMIIIPKDILLKDFEIPVDTDKNLEECLKQLYGKTEKEIINDDKVGEFVSYFSAKIESLLKTDMSTYDKLSIIFRGQLITLLGWDYGYSFPSSIIKCKPTGGFDLWLKKPLSEEKIQTFQLISNLINGKLCAVEMLK